MVIKSRNKHRQRRNHMSTNATNNILAKTILIGLPAVGKTTLTDELSKTTNSEPGSGIEAVSSDLKFRAVRKDKDHPVVQQFMKEHNIPDSDFPLLSKTNDFIKKYGEPIFRDLESAVVLDMLENGEFDGKIPNLGGKALLHPKTLKAFKQRGYNVIYLRSDLKTIASHIVKDFEALLDGATITRSPTNGPILEHLKEKLPDIAETSYASFMKERISKMRNRLGSTKSILMAKFKRKKEAHRHFLRNTELNLKALEVISKRHKGDHHLYEQAADKTVYLSGDLKEDVALLCATLGIDGSSANVKENDIYTNSIRSIISGIDEVVPYTYDDSQYNFKEHFNPIIKQVLQEAPSSDNPKLVHMLGIPGAGKTTYYQQHKDQYKDYVLIGFDLIMEKVPQYHQDREELGKIDAFKKWELPARIAGYELLRQAIEQKKNIYFDHGGTPICHRELLTNIKNMGYETTMYYIDCDSQTAIDRISNRERPFPAERMPERIDLVEKQKEVMPKIVDHFVTINNDKQK